MSRLLLALAALFALFPSGASSAEVTVPVFKEVSGEYREVLVEQGDTLDYLSARHGVKVSSIMRDNSIPDAKRLPAGKILTINTRRVVPSVTGNGLVADIAGGMLYRFEGGQLLARYPAGFGDMKKQTPTGEFTVLSANHYLDRAYPGSRTSERERESLAARRHAPPDEANSLGPFWISLSSFDLSIHATPFTATIGTHESAKHIRLGAEDMEKLVGIARPGMKLISVYLQTRLALTPDGSIWLEAHPDVYGLGEADVESVLHALGELSVDANRTTIGKVLREKRGVAELVGRVSGSRQSLGQEFEESESATFRCLDCPPGEDRRVTLQLAAKEPIAIDGEYPIEVLNAAGNVVFTSSTLGTPVKMAQGEIRNFIWELTDTHGRPLPMGQYTVRALFRPNGGEPSALSLPLWADR